MHYCMRSAHCALLVLTNIQSQQQQFCCFAHNCGSGQNDSVELELVWNNHTLEYWVCNHISNLAAPQRYDYLLS